MITTLHTRVMLLARCGLIALLGVAALSLAACGGTAPVQTAASTPVGQAAAPAQADEIATATTQVANTGDGATAAETSTPGGSTAAADCTLLNLNDLTEADLMVTIPGFSSRMVREFLEYRPYVSIQQFRREIGKYVDEAQVAEYEKYVFVPVDPNQSDAETLMQIPGVDAGIAAELMGARPFASNEAFLEALAAQIGEQQAAGVQCLIANP